MPIEIKSSVQISPGTVSVDFFEIPLPKDFSDEDRIDYYIGFETPKLTAKCRTHNIPTPRESFEDKTPA